MKIVALITSVLILVYLLIDFVNKQELLTQKPSIAFVPQTVVPAVIANEPLLAEDMWHKMKAERAKPKQTNNEQNFAKKELLTIGDKQYILFGIFNAKQKQKQKQINTITGKDLAAPFILIKASDEPIIKVSLGAELSLGVTLIAVESTIISFKVNNEVIEFKLFERKNNA